MGLSIREDMESTNCILLIVALCSMFVLQASACDFTAAKQCSDDWHQSYVIAKVEFTEENRCRIIDEIMACFEGCADEEIDAAIEEMGFPLSATFTAKYKMLREEFQCDGGE